jgi:hypothetical protein
MKNIICRNEKVENSISVLAITESKTFLMFKKYSKENTYKFLENKYYNEEILAFNPCYDLMPKITTLSLEMPNDLIYIIDEFTIDLLFDKFPHLKEHSDMVLSFILNISFFDLAESIDIKTARAYEIKEKYLELVENKILESSNK